MFGLSRPERRAANQYDSTMRMIAQQRLHPTYAGVAANYEDMLTVPAVWKSLQLTAGTISTMKVCAYRDGSDERTELSTLPALLRSPSGMVPREDWVFQNIESMIMHGDAIGRIVARDGRFFPSQVEMVDPRTVTMRKRDDGTWQWFFDRKPVPDDEVWHVPGRPQLGSPFGFGLIEFMAQVAGISLAGRKYEAQWFGDGAHPTLIYTPPTDPGLSGAEAIKEKLRAITRGNREPLVTAPGTVVAPFQSNPTDSSLIESMRANAADIAHFFGVPPELVGGSSGDSMTYSNVEARVLDLLAFAVQYWMTKLENALSRSLPQPIYVRFDEDDIVRTDLKTKVDTLVAEVKGGIRTPNEARKVRDLPALEGGDALVSAGSSPIRVAVDPPVGSSSQ